MTKYKRLPRKLKKGIRSLRSCRPRSKWQRKAYNCFFKNVKTLAEIERLHQNFLEAIPSGGLVVAAACDRNFYNFPKEQIGCVNPISIIQQPERSSGGNDAMRIKVPPLMVGELARTRNGEDAVLARVKEVEPTDTVISLAMTMLRDDGQNDN